MIDSNIGMTFGMLISNRIMTMDIKSISYEDANEFQYPVRINGERISSLDDLKLAIAIATISDNDTVRMHIKGNYSEMEKGDPVQDAGDVADVCSDDNGNVVLRGCGG